MWKRIQTLYTTIATLLVASMFFLPMITIIGKQGSEAQIMYYEKTGLLIMLIMLLAGGVCAIFSYKSWFLQARVCTLTALMQIGFQIWLAIIYFGSPDEMIFSFTMIFPLVAAILNFLAARSAMIDAMTVQAVKATKKIPKRKR